MAVYANAGQNCCARSRILVQRAALPRFLELFAEEAEVQEGEKHLTGQRFEGGFADD